MRLKNKTVFLTGGTGGIGHPLTALLRQEGAEVTLYDRAVDGDLVDGLDKLCARLAHKTPDILINLAGFNVFDHCEKQDMASIVALNMMVPIRLCQAVLPAMKKRRSGQIVNVGSMTALIPLPHLTGYVAAKAGLKGFSDALRRELLATGVSVTFITPRAVRTAMNSGIKADINRLAKVKHDAPEKVAGIILDAIIHRRVDVRIGWPERFFAGLHALCPAVIDQGLQRNQRIGEELLAAPAKQKHEKPEKGHQMKSVFWGLTLLLASTMGTLAQTAPSVAPIPANDAVAAETAIADPVMTEVAYLQTEWARIKYQVDGQEAKLVAIHALETKAAQLSATYPDRPEPQIWEAIILSTDAGIVKGMAALPKVTKAKDMLEAVGRKHPRAMEGSIFTSLGSLYYQVPGWPVAFGDDKKAEKYLKNALQINPDGIDPNFFYGDFLFQDKRYSEAETYLKHALQAAPRPGREVADAGRRQEIKNLLAKLADKTDKKEEGYN